MKTIEVKVLDGTVYTLKDCVSVGEAIEYLEKYVAKDKTPIESIGDGLQKEDDRSFGSIISITCAKMEDVEWLTKHVIIKPVGDVPLHHAWQLMEAMRRAIKFQELMEVVKAMQQPPDPDFPEDESKN